MSAAGQEADLLVGGATLVAPCDGERRELPGGWVAVTGGLISGVGASGEPPPPARETLDATGCLVTPGLVNTHHHLYQNLTRSYAPTVNGTLFEWLSGLYPLWAGLDEEASYLSAWVGLAVDAAGERECAARFGRRPVGQLAEARWLARRSSGAHCIYPGAA